MTDSERARGADHDGRDGRDDRGEGVSERLPGGAGAEKRAAHWTFLTNHAHVLMCIARNPGIRTRDIADAVGITDRAAQRIVADLEAAGYLSHQKTGRRNIYQIHGDRPLRHPIERDHAIGELVDLLARD